MVSSPEVGSQALQLKVLTVSRSMSVDLDVGEASLGEVISDLEVFTDSSVTVCGGMCHSHLV